MAIYNGSVINDLDTSTPTEGSTPPSEINDAIREVKACLKTTLAIEHSITNGMHLFNRVAKTADYTATATDHIIELDCTSANVDIDLPTAVGIEGQEYILKCTNADNTPMVTPNGTEKIDGSTGAVTLALNETLVIYSDNTNWQRRSITSVSGYIAIPGSSVQGNVLFHDGTIYNKLDVGTAGQVLTTQGASANPTWATPSTLIVTGSTNLIVKSTSGSETTQVDVDADEIILQSSAGVPYRVTSIDLTINMAGTLGAINSKWIAESSSAWYYVWVTNGTSGTCGGFHTSKVLATVLAAAPAGYNTYGNVQGAIRNDGSSNLITIHQVGNKVVRALTSAVSGNPSSYTSVSLSTVVPDTAKGVVGILQVANTGPLHNRLDIYVASTSGGLGELQHGDYSSGTGTYSTSSPFNLVLVETQVLYYKKAGTTGDVSISISGWEY